MIAVTVSPKFQVVIPKNVRESMGIIAGQKVQMLTYRNSIELIPIKPMSEMKGILKGIDTKVPKEKIVYEYCGFISMVILTIQVILMQRYFQLL